MYKKNDYAIKVGKNLKDARLAKGVTQKEIADEFRFTQQQYSRYESGVVELNYEQIFAFCKRYDITPNELFDIEQ